MSIPKAPSSKSKDVGLAVLSNAMTSFDRATQVLKEIETFLETELNDTPQLSGSYDTIIRPKSKRKRGPYLIKDISKNSKTRKTLNDMTYDPVLGIWVGNPDALKNFAVHPQLITSKARMDKPKSHGQMVWDPVSGKWIGNDTDLRVFEKRTVPLIAGEFKIKEFNGMSFDPVKMTWIGGDDDMPDFGSSSDVGSVKDDGFVVGTEFQLSPTTTQQFMLCAERHKNSTTGWWREEKTRDHLFVIRTMSVMRMVRDVRRSATSYYEELSFMDIAPEKEAPLRSPREPEADFDDAWDDMGPFDGTNLRLRDSDNSVDDLDAELDKLNQEDKTKKFASLGNRSIKLIVDEDWDDDFAAEDLKVLPKKLSNYKPIPNFNNDPTTPTISISTPTISIATPPISVSSPATQKGTITNLSKGGSINKKPFELLKSDAPHRRSFQMLPVEKKTPKIAWEDEDDGGLEIPAGPLTLKPKLNGTGNTHTDDLLDEDDVPSQGEDPENEEVEEEDWDDVALPASLGDPVTKHAPPSQTRQPDIERWDDLEIPAGKLELKVHSQSNPPRPSKSSHGRRGEDEDFDGLDIPEGMPLRLKKL